MKSNSEWEEEKLLPQGDVQEVGSHSQLVGNVSDKKVVLGLGPKHELERSPNLATKT